MSNRFRIDPQDGPKHAIAGRVVTMDTSSRVLDRGVVYIDRGDIVAVLPAAAERPVGFGSVKPVVTGGTIYPGLIELHNHLAYNALRLWAVPKTYTNRDQWGGTPVYRRLISGPMTVIGKTPGLLPALIRYVECKCLVAGVTTSQGIELFSNHGARRFYRGIVRNVEQTEDAQLPDASAKIADIEAVDAQKFLARLLKQTCFLLHLSEGTDARAREHFASLEVSAGKWAITSALAGIHCAALTAKNFATLGKLGGAMVWSPMSNLLLYGKTARVQHASRYGVRVGLGSDWSPTGSKNLLGELKVARLASKALGGIFTDAELVSMATRSAASILGWSDVLGSIEAGRRADLLTLDGTDGDPYSALLEARETSVALVMIAGVPRFGAPGLMRRLGATTTERIRVANKARLLNLQQPLGDPVVGAITFADARDTLQDALAHLPDLAKALEEAPTHRSLADSLGVGPLTWSLALDELQPTGSELRPRLSGLRGGPTGPRLAKIAAAVPLSTILEPLTLDALTVADDEDFLDRVEAQPNLPVWVREEFRALYS